MCVARDGRDRQSYTPAALLPGKTHNPLYRWLGGPQGRSGRVGKISTAPGFEPRTVQFIASRYTTWALVANLMSMVYVALQMSYFDAFSA
jgi:hypothetical protein